MGVPVPTNEYQSSGFVDFTGLIGWRFVGYCYLEVIATNTQGYSCDPVDSETITIVDDDTTVDIANLAIAVTPGIITVTFTDIDQSGITLTTFPDVDGMPVFDYTLSVTGNAWTITFPNAWAGSPGTHIVSIPLSDLDNDRPFDQASAVVAIPFTIAVGDIIKEQLLALEQDVLSATSWKKNDLESKMIAKIDEVIALYEAGNYKRACSKLLHDIKPKLTGLKTDENGHRWGCGKFKKPWITSKIEQSNFASTIDEILALLH
jgi:hypothetical protein